MSAIGRGITPGGLPDAGIEADAGAAEVGGVASDGGAAPVVVRGGAPVRPQPGVGAGPVGGTGGAEATGLAAPVAGAGPVGGVGAAAGTRRPVDPAVYGPILEEARAADWQGCGIDPVRYVEDRVSREGFLRPLLETPGAKVVLHRQALKIGQVASIDGSRTRNVTHPDSKDYPGRVYLENDGETYHLVGIAGEDWYRQTLHMLATAGVPAEKIAVEGVFDPQAIAARDLDATLAAHDFDSVTVGTMGELTRAVERVLRERARPAHTEKVLGEMGTFLESQARTARPDRRARWEEVARRFAEVQGAGGDAAARLARVQVDPVLRGPLGEHLRRAEDGPPAKELPLKLETRNADVFAHRVLEVDGKKHLLLHIGGAHGDMAYEAVKRVLAKEPALRRVNMYGSCGSFSDAIPPDTFVLPRAAIRSAEADRAPVTIRNAASLAGAVETAHSNVSTLLREHRAGLARLTGLPADTVDIESYHVARAVSEASAARASAGAGGGGAGGAPGRGPSATGSAGGGSGAGGPIELRAILRVSDVATSSALGAHRDDRAGTSDYDARRAGEEKVVAALGLVGGAP